MRRLPIALALLVLPSIGALCASGGRNRGGAEGRLEQMYAMCQRAAVAQKLILIGEMSKQSVGEGVWVGQVEARENGPPARGGPPRMVTCRYDVVSNTATLF